MEETILEKPDEAIWFIDNRVVKFHLSETFISDRIKRAKSLSIDKDLKMAGFEIPEIIDHDKNIYVMKRCQGTTLSKIINPVLFKELIEKYFNAVKIYSTIFEREFMEGSNPSDDQIKKAHEESEKDRNEFKIKQ